jgi:uncharacterized protein YyaL (SSP411 family)
MIAAVARAARVVGADLKNVGADLKVGPYMKTARRAALFIWKHLWNPETQTLLRRYRKGDAAVEGYAEDYAYLIFGLLELFQAEGDPRWLEWALILQRRQDELFADPVQGGWFSTTGRDESVLLRLKEDYDGAEPSATSVTVLNLLTLSHLADDRGFDESIERAFGMFASRIEQGARTVPMMMAALSAYHAGISQVVVRGDPAASATGALNDVVARRYLPFAITVPLVPEHAASLTRLLPWTNAMGRVETSAAYVCRDFACLTPATSAEELIEQLEPRRTA